MASTPDKLEAKRTVAFFRLVVQGADHEHARLPEQDWQALLGNIRARTLEDRTYVSPTRQLIGHVMSVDGEYALKLMEPRDENSWLEILKQARAAEEGADPDEDESDSEALDPTTLGQLVETTIVAFVPGENLFGIIRGSTSSPTHAAVAEWIDHLKIDGKRLLTDEKESIVAEPATSKSQAKKLKSSDGVSAASVRISTSKAKELEAAGSKTLGRTLRQLKKTYGNIYVTITLRVPAGKANDAARTELRKEALRLQSVSGSAEAVSATLVTYDAESRAHSEAVNFVSQRITTSTLVSLRGEDGEPIRNASAVRAIVAAAQAVRKELDALD